MPGEITERGLSEQKIEHSKKKKRRLLNLETQTIEQDKPLFFIFTWETFQCIRDERPWLSVSVCLTVILSNCV